LPSGFEERNKELSKNKMNHFTAPNQPKIDDQKWGCIAMNTTPFLIVDFRRFRTSQMVYFIIRFGAGAITAAFFASQDGLHHPAEMIARIGVAMIVTAIVTLAAAAAYSTAAKACSWAKGCLVRAVPPFPCGIPHALLPYGLQSARSNTNRDK
jgi:hypothetical protein